MWFFFQQPDEFIERFSAERERSERIAQLTRALRGSENVVRMRRSWVPRKLRNVVRATHDNGVGRHVAQPLVLATEDENPIEDPQERQQDVSPERLRKFFIKENGHYKAIGRYSDYQVQIGSGNL